MTAVRRWWHHLWAPVPARLSDAWLQAWSERSAREGRAHG